MDESSFMFKYMNTPVSSYKYPLKPNGRFEIQKTVSHWPNYLLVQDVTFLNRSQHSFISIRDNNLAKNVQKCKHFIFAPK